MTEEIIIKNKRQGINIYRQLNDRTLLIIRSKKYGDVEFIVDTDLSDTLMQYPWNVRCYKKSFYAYSYKDNKAIALHRFITSCPMGLMVDHINHNTQDNRKFNLKICTNKENQHNRKKFEGIKNTKWGYQVVMRVDSKLKCFGTYKTLEEAEQVRINAEKEYRPYVKEISKYGE